MATPRTVPSRPSSVPLPPSAFGLTAQILALSFLEPISLGAVVGIGLVVGIVVRCWVRPNRDFKASKKVRYAVDLDRRCGF